MSEDIINRLLPFIHDEMRMPAGMIKDVIEEIERLRDAGDALVAAIRNHVLSEKDVRAWEEARRG